MNLWRTTRCAALTALLLLVGVCASVPVSAGGGALTPTIAKGKGDKCVAPTEYMRRNHMDLLDHQRDDTVIDGIRTERFSLKGCVSCHAVKGEDGRAVTVKDERHFCASCHLYAAVNMDCFDCHASRPDEAKKLGALRKKSHARDMAVLKDYLKGAER